VAVTANNIALGDLRKNLVSSSPSYHLRHEARLRRRISMIELHHVVRKPLIAISARPLAQFA